MEQINEKWYYKHPFEKISDGAIKDYAQAKVIRFLDQYMSLHRPFVEVEYPDGTRNIIDAGWLYREGEPNSVPGT